MIRWALAVLLTTFGSVAVSGDDEHALERLIESEHAFNKASEEKGMRAAFLEFLAENSIVFQPGPVDGREAWGSMPENAGELSWFPEVADISDAGDLGFTSGPYTYWSGEGAEPSYGHYISVWRVQRDGAMRVELDAGVAHGIPPVTPQQSVTPLSPKSPSVADRDYAIAKQSLLDADTDFSREASSVGYARALRPRSAKRLRVYRVGQYPVEGESAIQTADETPRMSTWERRGDGIASSGDLGYTYGTAKRASVPPSYESMTDAYLRIWRRRGDNWILTSDLLVPLTPPGQPGPGGGQ